jgi:hypothetical protein
MHPLHGMHRCMPSWSTLPEVPVEEDRPYTNVRSLWSRGWTGRLSYGAYETALAFLLGGNAF